MNSKRKIIVYEVMLENIFHWLPHHQDTAFHGETPASLKALGLDGPSVGSSAPIHGPVEYIFKVDVSSPLTGRDGVISQTGTRTTPMISFIGKSGQSEMIPIKVGFKSGSLTEFSAIAHDVGQVSSIKIADPLATAATWFPKSIEVSRIGASDGKIPSHADGWVKFDVNRPVKEPVIINARTGASIKKE